jgi:hypothetical protein
MDKRDLLMIGGGAGGWRGGTAWTESHARTLNTRYGQKLFSPGTRRLVKWINRLVPCMRTASCRLQPIRQPMRPGTTPPVDAGSVIVNLSCCKSCRVNEGVDACACADTRRDCTAQCCFSSSREQSGPVE